MRNLKLFLDLIRFKQPIGFMLLFWPCLWGLTLSNNFSGTNHLYFKHIVLFFFGSILMRSAGCIVNDILDRKYDILVERTKSRPIASGKVSVFSALFYSSILCLIAFLILVQFNFMTIILGLISMPFAFTYPLMKRFTYWPQLFLGFTFNYGLIMAWFSINNEFSYIPIIFYIGAIFWTLGYDTIYGFQDINDDEVIGVKSTSIKFKHNPKKFISFCYFIFLMSLFLIGIVMKFNLFYYVSLSVPMLHLLYFQSYRLIIKNENDCLKKFKSNNFFGLIILINLLIGKII